VSQLPVQVKTDLTPVVSAIRQAVPERITEAGHPLANDYRWTFVRNGDPEVQIQDGLVAVHSEYRGDIETRLSSSGCRLNPVYPVVDTNGKLVLVQDRDAVSLAFEPTQTMVSLRPDGDNRCNMFNVPVKDKMAEVMGADQLTRALADSVQPQTFALPLQRIWDSLNAPLAVPVSTQNAKACLYGQPAEISLDGLKGTTENATISGLVKTRPTLTYERACSEPSHTAAIVNSRTAAPSSERKPFTILARVPVDYGTLTQQLQNKLFHQTIRFDSGTSKTTTIERVSASDANGRVLVPVELKGDVNGTVYYWGTPHLDDSGRTLSVPDLQMANESKTAVDSIDVGYWQVVDKELKPRIREALNHDLTAQVNNMKAAISGQHRAGDLLMDILITRQTPEQTLSTAHFFASYVLREGTASAVRQVRMDEMPARASKRDDRPVGTTERPAESSGIITNEPRP